MQKQQRPAFTLFELLVILAILGFLLGLLLPLIQRVREAAARMQSQNNMKQIGLACHNYHDTYRAFPSGVDKNKFSALAHMLPFIEQDNLFRRIDFKKSATGQENAQVRQAVIKTYINPQDSAFQPGRPSAPTNYQMNAGTKYSLDKNTGIFFLNSKITLIQVSDGTSNTVMAGETLLGDFSKQAKTVQRQYVELGKDALKNLKENSGILEFRQDKNIRGDRGSSWIDGSFLQATFTGTRKVNDDRPDVDCGGEGGLSALRTMGDTVNVLMCDGSVRAVNRRISFQTWQIVCGRDDGMVAGADF